MMRHMAVSTRRISKSTYADSRSRAAGMLLALLLCGAMPGAAHAVEDERVVVDARLETFPGNVTLDPGSTAFTWIVWSILTVLALSVLFKNAKRTHLD